MKNMLFLLCSLFIIEIASSQDLDFVFLEKLKDVSIEYIDDYMINHYDFKKIEVDQTNNSITFGRYFENDLDKSLVITIAFKEPHSNSLVLETGKNFDISNIRDLLVKRGYKKGPLKDFEYYTYSKSASTILISIVPNENGMNTVKFLSESR